MGAFLGALTDHASALGVFETVRTGEFKSTPPQGMAFAVWVNNLGASAEGSGLASTAGLAQVTARIYIPMLGRDEEGIEGRLADAADGYLERLNGDLTIGDLVRNVDMLGMDGPALEWTFGYLTIDKTLLRVADLPIRAVKNDAWEQAA